MVPEYFRFRTRVIYAMVLLWACCIVYSLLQYTVIQRESLLKESRSIAWREGVMPSVRGRILDADGIVLAWTELSSEVYLVELPEGRVRRQNLLRLLEDEFHFTYHDDMELPIRVSTDIEVTGENIERLCLLLDRYKELRLRNNYTRRYVDYAKVGELLGECSCDADGILSGESGMEKAYDKALSGTSGTFEVMQDRNGKWNPQTLVVLQKPEAGHDVRLGIRLGELLQK